MTYDNRIAHGFFRGNEPRISSTLPGAKQLKKTSANRVQRLTTRLSFVDRVTKLLGGLKQKKTILVNSRSIGVDMLPSAIKAGKNLFPSGRASAGTTKGAAFLRSNSNGRHWFVSNGTREKLSHTASNLG